MPRVEGGTLRPDSLIDHLHAAVGELSDVTFIPATEELCGTDYSLASRGDSRALRCVIEFGCKFASNSGSDSVLMKLGS